MSTTMVDKALRAAREVRAARLDAIASAELGYKVVTEYRILERLTGAFATKRADGKRLAGPAAQYIRGLWAGWQEHESTLELQQEKARR